MGAGAPAGRVGRNQLVGRNRAGRVGGEGQAGRCFVVWFPDWPVTAWSRAEAAQVGGSPGPSVSPGPVAVVGANRVLACSSAARAQGVRRGQRRREAQAACPQLCVVSSDPGRDQRLFEPILVRLEELVTGVEQLRPGLVAVRARGPARYHGGEAEAADAITDGMAALGLLDVRIGVADGMFAAEQAAYAARPVLVVPAGGSAAFLAPLPVNRLDDDELSSLLPRLGVRRLGEFAAFDVSAVRDRFGERGVRLRALAGGWDARPVVGRVPPPEMACRVDFEPPLEQVEQVAFAVRACASEFVAKLAAARLACTRLRVTILAERGEAAERVWSTATTFDAAAVVDRVRWQAQAASGMGREEVDAPVRGESGARRREEPGERRREESGGAIASSVVGVRLEPVATDAAWHHEPGLFGDGPDERVLHTVSRVQAMLGPDGVLTATIGGGRWLAERQVLTPWGERAVPPQPADRPWPGSLPAPLPAVVFPVPRPVSVLAASGAPVRVDERGALSASPMLLLDDGDRRRIAGWAGPWPVDERTWDPARHRRACRFQVVDTAQGAWLLVLDEGGSWWAEGRYD